MSIQWETQSPAKESRAGSPAQRNGGASNGKSRADQSSTDALARSLGWFSIGLGLAEVLAPRKIAKITGTHNNTGLIRAFGIREIVSGVGVLTNRQPAPWVWS